METAILTQEEREIDNLLGYPPGYGKLCKFAYTAQMQGLITPFSYGPPQSFLPYSIQEEEVARMREMEALFPMVEEKERINHRIHHHTEDLWTQLDHLGNAGFDPALFRVDTYGNVIYWNAHEGSPLAWSIDHWFPRSRGGKSVLSNLRLVQWQVHQNKANKLEFLVPWWDLQVGVSVNQFLSVFCCTNADVRHKSFSLFFPHGRKEKLDEKTIADCHSWPKSFLEKVGEMGLVSASFVRVGKDMSYDLVKTVDTNRSYLGHTGRKRWNIDEEETVRRALVKTTVNRASKDNKPNRANREDAKHDKENRIPTESRQSTILSAIEREEKIKMTQEEKKRECEAMLMKLQSQLQDFKTGNEKEKSILEEFERVLAKQRMKMEKQQKWSETQSQYRICLEKMIRDTMLQCMAYKEQARRNQDACTALVARLESQRKHCDVAEEEAEKNAKQRKGLEAMARPKITKRTRNAWQSDVDSWIDLSLDFDAKFINGHKGVVDISEKRENVKSFNCELFVFDDEMESESEMKNAMQAAMAEAIKADEEQEGEEAKEQRSPKDVGKFELDNSFQVLKISEKMEKNHTEFQSGVVEKSMENPESFSQVRNIGRLNDDILERFRVNQDQVMCETRGMALRKADTLKPVDGNIVIVDALGKRDGMVQKVLEIQAEEEVPRRRQPQRVAQNLAIKFETHSPITKCDPLTPPTDVQNNTISQTTTMALTSSHSTGYYYDSTASKLNSSNNTCIYPKSPSLCRTGGECRRTTPLQKQRPMSCERSIISTSATKPRVPHTQQTRQPHIVLSRQRSVGGGVGGGAARKADMLMKSASTRGNCSNSYSKTWTSLSSSSSSTVNTTAATTSSTSTSSEVIQSPSLARAMARRCHSSNVGPKGSTSGAEQALAAQPVQSRRKPSGFFQDLDSSISHVWKKAVKKFDLTRQLQ